MSVTSTANGDHWRFTMKITMGPSLQEYQDLAKKSHMDDLHLEILKLRDRVGAIQRTQDYAKEKSALLQKAIESNNNKTTWVSVIQ
uniref:GOLD domain-containing protein n=1 Tax=Globisporangium ultimum (strain ATCC 200006 / CBS 805.95 / DAOM BR144) TaxID=431595 RepID=K3X012_GLOUD